MWSSRTILEDKKSWPWPWPRPLGLYSVVMHVLCAMSFWNLHDPLNIEAGFWCAVYFTDLLTYLVALTLTLASRTTGLSRDPGTGFKNHWPWPWPWKCWPRTDPCISTATTVAGICTCGVSTRWTRAVASPVTRRTKRFISLSQSRDTSSPSTPSRDDATATALALRLWPPESDKQ